jgi:hypothetical protein
MNGLIRSALSACVDPLLALGVFGLRFVCCPADMQMVFRDEQLRQLHRATARRQELRRQIVQELIAQRCTLADALEQFEELGHEWPDYSAAPPNGPAQGTRQERKYRHIMAIAEAVFQSRPKELAAVFRRLKKASRQLQPEQRTALISP